MYNTTYHRASSVADAAAQQAAAEDGKYVSGGMTLIATMKQRLASPSDLVDLRHIAELKGITVNGRNVRIGAATTHFEVATSAALKAVCPAISNLASMIGDPHVRHMGTIGGSVANNDPASSNPAPQPRHELGNGRAVAARAAAAEVESRSPACSKPCWNRAKSSPPSSSRHRQKPATRSSRILHRAMRWPAFSLPRLAMAVSGLPSLVRVRAVCSGMQAWNRHLRRTGLQMQWLARLWTLPTCFPISMDRLSIVPTW